MRTLKQSLLGLVACLALQAQADQTNTLQWSWETQFRSEYMGKVGIVFYDKPLMVNDVSASYGDFYAGLWVSSGLGGERYGSTFSDEYDLYAGWGHTFDWVRFQLTAAYFAIKDLDRLGNDLWIVEPEVCFPKFPVVKPYVAVRKFSQISSESPDPGWFVWPGVRRSQPLWFDIGEMPARLNLDLMGAYSDGTFDRTPGWVFIRLTAGLPIAIGKHLTVTPSVLCQVPIDGQQNNPKPYTTQTEILGQLSLRWKF